MGQRHRQRASINPALAQSIVLVPPACRYRQHEVLTRAEWILASTGDAGLTFSKHWVGVGLFSPPAVCTAGPQPSKHEALNQCWFDAGPAPHTLCFAHARCEDIKTVAQLIKPKDSSFLFTKKTDSSSFFTHPSGGWLITHTNLRGKLSSLTYRPDVAGVRCHPEGKFKPLLFSHSWTNHGPESTC